MTLRIGISARLLHNPPAGLGLPTKRLQFLESGMAQWIMSHGVLALMIPFIDQRMPGMRKRPPIHDLVDNLDGLVLQGGIDISPETYGEKPWQDKAEYDPIRDEYELELLRGFIEADKPVVGICRGCQLINVALGGTLYQDIPSQRPSEVQHLHVQQYDRQFHDAEILPGSGLARLYPGVQRTTINSIHHQAVKDLGRDLVVEARSVPDGLVEAIRWRGPSLVFGMQWHPEFMAQDRHHPSQLDGRPILEEFLAACLRRRG